MEEPIGGTPDTGIDMLEPIETHIREKAQGIAEKKSIPEQVLNRVAGVLIEKIREKSLKKHDYLKHKPLILHKSDVKEIGDNLIIGNPASYQTWLHRDSFNRVVFVLNIDRTMKAPFFNIPQQIQRMLIIHVDHKMLKNLEYIIAIREDLLAFNMGEIPDERDETDDCLCSFLAAAMLFGKMTFPGVEKIFAWLEFCDISLSPISLSLKLNKADKRDIAAFCRNFLPAPASNYFLRLMLSCSKSDRAERGRSKLRPNDIAFPGWRDRIEKIHYIFMKWTKKRLQLLGLDTPHGVSIETFREASMLLSIITLPDSGERLYPPFLLSVLSKGITSDSVAWPYFIHCPEPFAFEATNQKDCSLRNSVKKGKTSTPFQDAMAEVKSLIRTPLRTANLGNTQSLRAQRRKIVSGLKSIKESCRDSVESAEYENLVFFVEWLESLFSQSKPSIKTITNYAKDAEELLTIAPVDGSIITLGSELETLLRQVLDEKKSAAVTNGLRSFLFYLETVTGTFKTPRRLHKEEMPSQKPLVFPEQVQAALNNMGLFFFRHLGRYSKQEAYIKNYRIASHKSEIIFHLVMLAFYAGLRIVEFRALLIGNVIYDDGIMLCVTTSKTSNGVRNIPLSILMPQWYLEEFLAYWRRRKSSARADGLLFPWLNEGFVSKSFLTNEINRLFESVGVPKVTAHILRHAFPNWFLLRWFFIFYPEYKADDIPCLGYELFNEEPLTRFKRLFPRDCFSERQSPITHALAVLARLLGHGGPIVTLEKYVHVTDWIFYFMSRGFEERKISITSRQAEQLLQVSNPTLPDALKGRVKKTLSYKEILYYQVEEFKQRNWRASRFMFGSDSKLAE